jgi:hypothetical protein
MRDLIHASMRDALLNPIKEPLNLVAGSQQHPDIYVPAWTMTPMAFDITVPSPLWPSNAAAAAADHVAWLESVASLKRRKYSDALRAKGVALRPLVVDVFGSAHREFQDTIHHIARLRASATGELFSSMVAQLFQRVSFALHRAVGACIVARSDLFAQ